MSLVIGLTGGIASGKSTVSTILHSFGLAIIDADLIAREVVMIGEQAYYKIVDAFGTEILLPDQNIDRKKLGTIIFNNKAKRDTLNSIVHPAVRSKMLKEKERYLLQGYKTVVMDIPLLYESDLTYLVDKTILVYIDEDKQLERLMNRNQFSKSEASSRISSQMPLVEKVPLADAVINNNGTVEETKIQLEHVLASWNIT